MNKVCLVTGAKKGIGLAVSQKLASEGYQVVMLDQETIIVINVVWTSAIIPTFANLPSSMKVLKNF